MIYIHEHDVIDAAYGVGLTNARTLRLMHRFLNLLVVVIMLRKGLPGYYKLYFRAHCSVLYGTIKFSFLAKHVALLGARLDFRLAGVGSCSQHWGPLN